MVRRWRTDATSLRSPARSAVPPRPLARAWRAEIAEDPEDGEPAAIAYYCPGCWEAEFRKVRGGC